MGKVPRRVRRVADRRVARWVRSYAQPEAAVPDIRRDIFRWIDPVADELMDVAQERLFRTYVGMMLILVGSAFGLAVSEALGKNGLHGYDGWTGVAVVVVFVLPAFLLLRPVSTTKMRARIRSYVGEHALVGVLRRRAFVVPSPGPRSGGVSAQEAEHLVRDWMAHLGAPEAVVTAFQRDGGIDVRADGFVAQVKNWTGKVPVHHLRDFQGAAQPEGKCALFFTSGSYTADARAYARSVRMALFIYRPVEGRLVGANPDGRFYRTNGLHVHLPEPKVGTPQSTPAHSFGRADMTQAAR